MKIFFGRKCKFVYQMLWWQAKNLMYYTDFIEEENNTDLFFQSLEYAKSPKEH